MPSSNFLFVEVRKTGKVPAQRDVRTAIQKHVMRDIGIGRRGQPRPQRRPENESDFKKPRAPSWRELVPSDPGSHTGHYAKVPSLVLGGHRADPFARFPIHMTSETSALMDYRE
jgi:hypothetical protein